MADWRKAALIAGIASAIALVPLTACGRNATRDVDEDVLAELTLELGIRECQRRLDSLAFRMEGILFDADVDITDREAVIALVPYVLPVCPVSGDAYLVRDEGMVLVFSCPEGHGSAEAH